MTNIFQGSYQGKNRKIAIVASRFNDFLVQSLIKGAVDCLQRHQTSEDDIDLYRVPGAYEIAPIAGKLSGNGKYDGIICLGVVIRGGTPHFDYIASEAAKGIAQTANQAAIPVIFGLITADNIEQAIERAGTKAGNKGADAAFACLEMIDLYNKASNPE